MFDTTNQTNRWFSSLPFLIAWCDFPVRHVSHNQRVQYCQDTCKFSQIPSGKRLHNYGRIHHFQWENPLFLWSFSIAMLVITRGYPFLLNWLNWPRQPRGARHAARLLLKVPGQTIQGAVDSNPWMRHPIHHPRPNNVRRL